VPCDPHWLGITLFHPEFLSIPLSPSKKEELQALTRQQRTAALGEVVHPRAVSHGGLGYALQGGGGGTGAGAE